VESGGGKRQRKAAAESGSGKRRRREPAESDGGERRWRGAKASAGMLGGARVRGRVLGGKSNAGVLV